LQAQLYAHIALLCRAAPHGCSLHVISYVIS